MISVQSVSILFSGIPLFENVSFLIQKKDKIGLVGKNGVGKSTMMKVIAGLQNTTSGQVAFSGDSSVGYLPQEMVFDHSITVMEEVLKVFEEANTLEKEIEEINIALAEREDYESEGYQKLIESLTDKHDRLHILEAHKKESEVEKVLKGLGFQPSEFHMSMGQFSGGWQMRVELAKLLLIEPSLLLLDEPTNHLDMQSIIWLEHYLKQYKGAVMMISHDRSFLDNLTNRTIEIAHGKIYDYKASYSLYMVLREEQLETQKARAKNEAKRLEQEERFIEKFRSKSSKAKQVQSKIKLLEKRDDIEFDLLDERQIKFHFPPAPHSGEWSVRARDVEKKYDEKLIFSHVDMDIDRGEKVCFIGQNGMGKSTLVKMLMHQTNYEGDLATGHNVKIGYYAQIQENTLDQSATVFDTLDNIAVGEWRSQSKIRALLGAFLFTAEDMDKKVSVLSGGEKSRLALAKMLLEPYSMLILDEPTNHLDISAKEMLKEALLQYNGTLIVVSHDRDFLRGLTQKTYEFANRTVKTHLGPIDDFLDKYEADHWEQLNSRAEEQPVKKKKEVNQKDPKPKLSYEDQKEFDKKRRKIKNRINNLEKEIESLEEEIDNLETELAKPENATNSDMFVKHSQLQENLNKSMTSWEKSTMELDEFDNR